MRSFLALLLLAGGVAAIPHGLQELLEDVVKRTSATFNCSVSVAVRDAAGEVTAAAGTVNFGTGQQARASDKYAWGSVTKILTGSSIMRLASTGRFGLDDDVAPLVDPLLAEMAAADPAQNFSSLEDLFGSNVSGTTVRQLLGMTSNVPDFDTATPCTPLSPAGCVPTDSLRAALYGTPGKSWSPAELLQVPWVAHNWGDCKNNVPGKIHFCYSSTNFMLLGLVLARQYGYHGWAAFDQGAFLPESLKGRINFVRDGPPSSFTPVHGYDRTSYNLPKGKLNDHDVANVNGVFSGWTASDIVATASTIANLTWEIYGPPASIAPPAYVEKMLPGSMDIYGLATFGLSGFTGQPAGPGQPVGPYARAYGHLGATYGYQSVTAFFPKLQLSIAVATNIETDFQTQPGVALCLSYSAYASLALGKPIHCNVTTGSYYGGACKCDRIGDGAEQAAQIVV